MANDKETIKKLIKIAKNQQNIITKMAQQMGLDTQELSSANSWNQVSTAVQDALALIPEAQGFSVAEAEVSALDGNLRGKVRAPSNAAPGSFRTVLTKLKELLAGKQVNSDEGKSVAISTDPNKITLISMSGNV